jgi:hypothetical protein
MIRADNESTHEEAPTPVTDTLDSRETSVTDADLKVLMRQLAAEHAAELSAQASASPQELRRREESTRQREMLEAWADHHERLARLYDGLARDHGERHAEIRRQLA